MGETVEVSAGRRVDGGLGDYVQTPRPRYECMKLAYFWMIIFCSSVGVRTSTASVAAPKLCDYYGYRISRRAE